MHAPGDLITPADYAFAWRALEPRPDDPRALLVLLHGVDGDETQLAALARHAPEGTLVAMPRGPRSISGDRIGWYRVGLSDDGLQVVEDEAEEARCRLLDFVHGLRTRHDISARRTVLAGFSQGGMLAAAAALSAPDDVGAFAMVSGTIVAPVTACSAAPRRLAGMHALLVHGRSDETLPVDEAVLACNALADMGVAAELRLHDAGHEPAPVMLDEVARWLPSVLDR